MNIFNNNNIPNFIATRLLLFIASAMARTMFVTFYNPLGNFEPYKFNVGHEENYIFSFFETMLIGFFFVFSEGKIIQ